MIFVRRGGPNYQEGLRVMGEVGKHPPQESAVHPCLPVYSDGCSLGELGLLSLRHRANVCPVCVNIDLLLHVSSGKTTGIPIHVFGTETHMTAIVGMALGHRPIPNQPPVAAHTANFLLSSGSASVGHMVHVV